MKYLLFILLVITGCTTIEPIEKTSMVDLDLGHELDMSHEQFDNSLTRPTCSDIWHSRNTYIDTLFFQGGYSVRNLVSNGPNAGYKHSPKETDSWGEVSYVEFNTTYYNYHADNRFSKITDISYKERGVTKYRPAKVRIYVDGSMRVERFLGGYLNDAEGKPAVVNINSEGDTTFRQCYDCDKVIPCSN